MEIDNAIRIFVDLLNISWKLASQLLSNRAYTSDEDSFNDWLQGNWELLVERKVLSVNDYLEPYGDGADYNGRSSRITDPDAMANFKVIIRSKDSEVLDVLNKETLIIKDFSFEKFVGFENAFYTSTPVFEYVLAFDYAGKERVFALKDVVFDLKPTK